MYIRRHSTISALISAHFGAFERMCQMCRAVIYRDFLLFLCSVAIFAVLARRMQIDIVPSQPFGWLRRVEQGFSIRSSPSHLWIPQLSLFFPTRSTPGAVFMRWPFGTDFGRRISACLIVRQGPDCDGAVSTFWAGPFQSCSCNSTFS